MRGRGISVKVVWSLCRAWTVGFLTWSIVQGRMWRTAVSFRAREGWSMLLICCGWANGVYWSVPLVWCTTKARTAKPGSWGAQFPQSLHVSKAGSGLVLVECHRVILDTNGGGASLCQKQHWAPHGGESPLCCCVVPALLLPPTSGFWMNYSHV